MPFNQVTKRYFGLKFAQKDSHVEYPVLFLERYITPPPPSSNDQTMVEYLISSLSAIESEIPNCAFLLAGDFNRVDISSIKRQFKLKQVVDFPTRAQNTLDLILTNLSTFYEKPEKFPPFGLSDHCTITFQPQLKVKRIPLKLNAGT